MKKQTIINLLLIAFVLSFFFTPVGYEGKVLLQKLLASQVDILPKEQQYAIDENWMLKDRNDVQFNFKKSQGRVKMVYFWSSWRAMSIADLDGIDKLYADYHQKIDFYLITNELPEPVEQLQADRKYQFKPTYLIIGEKMPFDAEKIPSGYIINRQGVVVAQGAGNCRWNGGKVRDLIEELLGEN